MVVAPRIKYCAAQRQKSLFKVRAGLFSSLLTECNDFGAVLQKAKCRVITHFAFLYVVASG